MIYRGSRSNHSLKPIVLRLGNVYGNDGSGILGGIKRIFSSGGWKSSLLYHHLADKRLFLVEINNVVSAIVKAIDDPLPRERVVRICDEIITVNDLAHRLKVAKPAKIPLGKIILICWQALGRLLRRGDLLIYLHSEK